MALLSFLLIMGAIFYLTFGSLGLWLSDIMADGVHWWVARLSSILDFFAVNAVVHSLIIDGVCAGVGSVHSFLPVIAVLFFCLSIIETCGYLSYISAKMDRWLRRIGLSGFSFVPLLTGFGCSVPAIMAAGKLPSRYDKCLTIFLIPFMSCSAKLPIYTLIAPIFFAEKGILVIALLYLTGILCAL